jgi:hypothetical protein
VTFEGRLTVAFEDPTGTSRLTAALSDVRVRLLDRTQASSPRTLELAQRAGRLRADLGIRELESDGRGVVLTRLEPEGALARAGAETGDLVTRVDGTPVLDALDFLAADPSSDLRMELLREGRHPYAVTIARAASHPRDRLGFAFMALACLAGLWFPIPRHLLPSRYSVGRPVRTMLCCTVLAGLSLACFGALDVRVLFVLPATFHLGALAYAYLRGTLRESDGLDACIDLGIAALAIATLGVPNGTLQAPLAAPDATAAPWSWPLLAAPSAWLALALLASSKRASRENPPLLPTAAKLTCVVAFGMAAGGAPQHLFPASTFGATLAGLAMFALKLPLAALLLSVRLPLPSGWKRAALAVVAPLAALALASLMPLDAVLSRLLGSVCFGLVAGFAGQLVLRRFTKSALRDPSFSPFL